MNKYKDLLEKNSQWIAVGIGGIWLLYMIYAHVLASTTATVEIKGEALGPAYVDEYVKVNTIDKLKDAMVKNVPWKPKIIDFPTVIADTIMLKDGPTDVIAGHVWNMPIQVPLPGDGTGTKPPPPGTTLISALPVVPPAINPDAVAGKSIVTVPAAANGQPFQNRQLWVSVFGAIPMKELEKAFKDAGVFATNVLAAQQTVILRVEYQREELLPNGKFGNAITVISPPINLSNPAAGGPLFPPLPPNQVGPQLTFRNSAAAIQQLICQPEFFSVTKGDMWHKPGEPDGQVGAPPVPIAPPPPPPTGKKPPTTPPRNTGRGRENGSIISAENSGRGLPFMQVFSDHYPTPAGGVQPGGAAAPVQPANAPGAVPAAPFSPVNLNDVNIWAHDLAVQPGKTYRYKIRYTISNPVFQFKNLVPPTKQAWAAQFDLTSDWSSFTPAITVPDTTNVFLATAIPNKGDAVFDVFTWGVGGVVKNTVRCQAGDLIDENLKLYLLDVRSVNRDYVVLLVDENGVIYRRSQSEDNGNKAYQQLKFEAANPQPLAP